MALGFTKNSGEEFLPSFRFNSVSGDATVNGSKKNADGVTWDKFEHEVKFPVKLAADFANIQTGWIHFSASGPSFHLVKLGERLPPKPSEDHKQGFKLRLYNKEFGACDFANSSKTVGEALDFLHDEYLKHEKENAGKIPVIEITGVEKIVIKTREGSKNYKKPAWSIVSWIPRPEALAEKVEEPKVVETSDDDF